MVGHASLAGHAIVTGVCLTAIAWYVWAAGRAPSSSPWPLRRVWAFVGGVAAWLVSVSPPFETLAERSFAGHMIQHLIMIIVSAPLVVVAQVVRLARVSSGHHAPAALSGGRRAWRQFGPLLAAACFVGVLIVTHLTGIYDAAIRHQWIHDLEHVAYWGSAVMLWAAIATSGRTMAPRRIGAVFAVIAGTALLAMVLLTAPRPLIDSYAERRGIEDALDDQRVAAALMWISGMTTTLPLLVLAFWRWAGAEHRATVRAESITDRA